MEIPPFPAETALSRHDPPALMELLGLYAQCLAAAAAAAAAACCREFVARGPDSVLATSGALRRAVFLAVFRHGALRDAAVETYFDVVACFGPTNASETRAFLESAPRSIPLKLGRLLLFKSEFGSNLPPQRFADSVRLLLGVPRLAEAALTPEFIRALEGHRRLNHTETAELLRLAAVYAPGGDLQQLASMFPQFQPAQIEALLRRTQLPASELTQRILDDPAFVDGVLAAPGAAAAGAGAAAANAGRYVDLDERERESRRQRTREESRRHFVYEYEADSDPELDEDDGDGTGPSEADRKLAAQEDLLWAQWEQHREVFAREQRRSPQRAQLRAALQWTNEQIEGWARFTGSRGRNPGVTMSGGVVVESYGLPTERPPRRERRERTERTERTTSTSKRTSTAPNADRAKDRAKDRSRQKDVKARKSGKAAAKASKER